MNFSIVSVASGIFPLRMGINIFPGSAEKGFLEMICFRSLLMGEKYCYSCYQYFPANHKLKGSRCPIKGNQSWIFIGSTDVEAPILWPPNSKNWLIRKDPYAGQGWKQEEKGTDRGWDGWMASLTQWTWVWASSVNWWTGKPGVLQSMGSQRVSHDWATELRS